MTTAMSEKRLKNLIDLRVDAGLRTQKSLAEAAQLSETEAWKAEKGRRITRVTARAIVNALKARGIEVEIDEIDWNVKQ